MPRRVGERSTLCIAATQMRDVCAHLTHHFEASSTAALQVKLATLTRLAASWKSERILKSSASLVALACEESRMQLERSSERSSVPTWNEGAACNQRGHQRGHQCPPGMRELVAVATHAPQVSSNDPS